MSLWSRIANVFRGDRLNREIDEELESHIQEAIQNGRDPAEVRRRLKAIGAIVTPAGRNRLKVVPPPFRPDVNETADLAEEVARLAGLAEIPHWQRIERSGAHALRKFDVAVSGFRPARLNPEHDDLAFGRGLECGSHESQVASGLRDHVIGWKHAHHGIGIDGLQDVRRQTDCGGRVSLGRLG